MVCIGIDPYPFDFLTISFGTAPGRNMKKPAEILIDSWGHGSSGSIST
jgi:hypothetical protein